MSGEGLHTLLLADIPQLSEGVASARNELVVVERVDAQTHHVTQMVGKLVHLGASLQIPKHASHVTRRSKDTLVADEAAATEVTRVTRKLSGNTGWALAGRQVVDGADVVQTTASHVVSGRRVGAGHDP